MLSKYVSFQKIKNWKCKTINKKNMTSACRSIVKPGIWICLERVPNSINDLCYYLLS